MDNIDLKILDMLQVNGRITMKELAQHVGLTSPATIERVKKLEEARIISGYKAVLNIDLAGLPIRVFILVTISEGPAEAVGDYAQKHSSILGCHRVAGSASHILEAAVANLAALGTLLDDLGRLGIAEPLVVLSSCVENKPVVLP